MKREGLQAIAPKRCVPRTTDSRRGGRTSPNLLKELANDSLAAGEAVVGDITYSSYVVYFEHFENPANYLILNGFANL